jgi:hypothetical protein
MINFIQTAGGNERIIPSQPLSLRRHVIWECRFINMAVHDIGDCFTFGDIMRERRESGNVGGKSKVLRR